MKEPNAEEQEGIPAGSREEGSQANQSHDRALVKSTLTVLSKATGPKTLAGKSRSKNNATKHGIFSAVILKNESSAEYKSLVADLCESFQPDGKFEEILVEKLAMLLWRHRRLLLVEAAEVHSNVDFVSWDHQKEQQKEADRIGDSPHDYDGGLIRQIHNPIVLERCMKMLTDLCTSLQEHGFLKRHIELLVTLYGDPEDKHLNENLQDEYLAWVRTSLVPEEERVANNYATPEQCNEYAFQATQSEIARLRRYKKTRARIETERTQLQAVCRAVPRTPVVDRLMKYEASLERAFDRTLNQLERIQRMRLGHPVPPPIKVEVSS